MKKCRHCGGEIMDDATLCKHCWRKQSDSVQTQQQSSESVSTLLHAGWMLVVFVFFLIIFTSSNGSEKAKQDKPRRDDACLMAQIFVEKSLKAPSTAKFASLERCEVTDLGQGKWRVVSYVDAQNSFGAMLRNHYVVEMQYAGGDNWKRLSLVLE